MEYLNLTSKSSFEIKVLAFQEYDVLEPIKLLNSKSNSNNRIYIPVNLRRVMKVSEIPIKFLTKVQNFKSLKILYLKNYASSFLLLNSKQEFMHFPDALSFSSFYQRNKLKFRFIYTDNLLISQDRQFSINLDPDYVVFSNIVKIQHFDELIQVIGFLESKKINTLTFKTFVETLFSTGVNMKLFQIQTFLVNFPHKLNIVF